MNVSVYLAEIKIKFTGHSYISAGFQLSSLIWTCRPYTEFCIKEYVIVT